MFGKSDWFRATQSKYWIQPLAWQGWAYLGGWSAVFLGPAKLLAARGQVPEAAIWALVSGGVAAWDYRKLVRQVQQKAELDRLHVIEDQPEVVISEFSLNSNEPQS